MKKEEYHDEENKLLRRKPIKEVEYITDKYNSYRPEHYKQYE